jgi:hypothetical protein
MITQNFIIFPRMAHYKINGILHDMKMYLLHAPVINILFFLLKLLRKFFMLLLTFSWGSLLYKQYLQEYKQTKKLTFTLLEVFAKNKVSILFNWSVSFDAGKYSNSFSQQIIHTVYIMNTQNTNTCLKTYTL